MCACRALSARILVGDSTLACRAFAALVLLAGGAASCAAAFVLERVLLAGAVLGTIGATFLWRRRRRLVGGEYGIGSVLTTLENDCSLLVALSTMERVNIRVDSGAIELSTLGTGDGSGSGVGSVWLVAA